MNSRFKRLGIFGLLAVLLTALVVSYPFASFLSHGLAHEFSFEHAHDNHDASMPHHDSEIKDSFLAVLAKNLQLTGLFALFLAVVLRFKRLELFPTRSREYRPYLDDFPPTRSVFSLSPAFAHAPPA